MYILMTHVFFSVQHTLTPAKMPVVDTLKSRYANISGVGGLYIWGLFFLGRSSGVQTKAEEESFTSIPFGGKMRTYCKHKGISV